MKQLFISLFVIMSMPIGTVQAKPLTLERIFDDPSLAGKSPVQLKFSPDGSRVTYLQGKADDYNRYDLWEYNLKDNTNRLPFPD